MLQIGDHYFIDLRIAGEQVGLERDFIREIKITESMNYLLPTFKLEYDVPLPIFHEYLPLTGFEPIEIDISETVRDENRLSRRFRVMDYKPSDMQGSSGRSDKPSVVIRGFMEDLPFVREENKRSFNGTPSEAVEELVSDATSNTDIETCHSRTNDTYIQPGWSNGAQIRDLQNSAISTNRKSNYRAFFRYKRESETQSSKEFVFRTIDSMYQQPKPDDPYGELRYAPAESPDEGSEQSDTTDNKKNNLITGFNFKNDARRGMQRGSLGFKKYAYDREDGEYKESYKTIQTIDNHVTLTDRYLYRTEQNINQEFMERPNAYVGRFDSDTPDWFLDAFAEEEVLDANQDVTKIDVRVRKYLPRIMPGTKINIKIHDASVEGNEQEVIAGDWLVEEMSTYIKGKIWTSLRLTRDGLNEPRTQQYRFSETENTV